MKKYENVLGTKPHVHKVRQLGQYDYMNYDDVTSKRQASGPREDINGYNYLAQSSILGPIGSRKSIIKVNYYYRFTY